MVVQAGESKCVNTDTHECRDLVWQVYICLYLQGIVKEVTAVDCDLNVNKT